MSLLSVGAVSAVSDDNVDLNSFSNDDLVLDDNSNLESKIEYDLVSSDSNNKMESNSANDKSNSNLALENNSKGFLNKSSKISNESAESIKKDSIIFVDGDTAFSSDTDECLENYEEDSFNNGSNLIDPIDSPKDGSKIVGPRDSPSNNAPKSGTATKINTVLDVNGFSKYYLNATNLVGYLKDDRGNRLSNKIVSIIFSNRMYNRTTDSNGKFSLNVNLYPNNYTFTVKFAGDSKYQSCSKNIVVKVFTMPTSISASNIVKYYLNGTDLVATLKDGNNNPLVGANMTIKFSEGNTVYNRTTDSNGRINLNIKFTPRISNATISFALKGYKSSSKTITVTVKNMPTSIISANLVKFYLNNTQWTARLVDAHNKPLAGKKLIFTIPGNSYERTTDSNGYANLDIKFTPRLISGKVNFSENYYVSSSKTVSITVLSHNVYFANASDNISSGSRFYFRLLNDGKSFPNQKVTVNINGQIANVTTNNNGIASVKVNLDAGYWPISLYYKGNNYNSSAEGHGYLTVEDYSKTYSINSIADAAVNLNRKVNAEYVLPSSITVSNDTISIFEFSYLMAKAIHNIGSGDLSDIRLPYIYKGSNSDSSFIEDLNVYSYMSLIDNIISFSDANAYLPANVSLSVNTLGFKDYTFSFSKILSFYKSTGTLPEYSLDDYKKHSFVGMSYFATGINEHYLGENTNQYLADSDECKITPEIRNKVNSLTNGVTSIESKAEIIFNFVRDTVSYSYYDGSKQGANKTLSLGKGNCIDQTSLLISMFRVLNIPARYNLAENVSFYSGYIGSHCWAQVLIGNVWHIADTHSYRNLFGTTYSCDLTHITNLKQGNLWNNLSKVNINRENISSSDFTPVSFSFNNNYVFHNANENSTASPGVVLYSSEMPLNTVLSYQVLSNRYGSSQAKIGLKDSNGLGLANKTIIATINGTSYNCTTDLWGFTYLNINLAPNSYPISFSFDGNSFYKPASSSNNIQIVKSPSNIKVLNKTIYYGDYLRFVVLDNDGYGIFNQTLKVNLSGTVYNLKTDILGNAILNKTLNKGNYNIQTSLSSSLYASSSLNFSLSVKDKTKLTANDMICYSGDKNLIVSLKSNKNPLKSKSINYKILNSTFNQIKQGTLNTDNNGKVSIPTNNLNVGKFYVYFTFNGDSTYLSSSSNSYLYIINRNIKTNIYNTINVIHQKGEKLGFYLRDSLDNPLSNKNVAINLLVNSHITTYNRTTDENGYLDMVINLNRGNYTFYTKFQGDNKYQASSIFTDLIVSHSPNIAYQVNMTTKDTVYVNNKKLIVPYGREIGIYKNNKLYKFAYSYTGSGITTLSNKVYYFFSLNDNKSAVTVTNATPITDTGFLLYADESNVIVKYLSYSNKDISSFSAIFDGKSYNNKYISNVTILSNNNKIASFYFSSEIFTSDTKAYLKNMLNQNYDNYKRYEYVHNRFGFIDDPFEVLKPCPSDSAGFSEHLCYGDLNYLNILKNAHWNQKLGYEAIETYLINNGQIINKDILKDYANNFSKYSGAKKSAYECFLINLAYDMFCDSLSYELSEKYDSSFIKGLLVSGTNIGVEGRTFDNPVNHKYFLSDRLKYHILLNEYSFKTSLLEQYVMRLTGYNSTCAVSEVLKALFNGENLSSHYENGNFMLGLMDNSSYLNYSSYGGFASIIFDSVKDNYLSGGVALENYDFNQTSPFVNNLNNLLSTVFSPELLLGPILGDIIQETLGSTEEGRIILKYFSSFVASELGTYLIIAGVTIMVTTSPLSLPFVGGVCAVVIGSSFVLWSNGVFDQPENKTRYYLSAFDVCSASVGKVLNIVGYVTKFTENNPSSDVANIIINFNWKFLSKAIWDSLKSLFEDYLLINEVN